MAEGDTPPVTPPSTPPAGDPPTTPPSSSPAGTPPAGTPPPAPPAEGTVSKAEFDRVKKEYEEYRTKVDPVLETIYTDPDTLRDITVKHKKRLGQLPADTPTTPPGGTPPAAPVVDKDTRNSQINMISDKFEEKVGINNLPDDKKAEIRGMVGSMIKEMVDPKGNKDIAQVFEEISLTKLPWYFEKAYDLVSKDSQIAAKIEEEKTKWENEQRGVMGGVPSSSIDVEQISLSAEERKVAANMGLTEDQYLEQKKAIIKRRES